MQLQTIPLKESPSSLTYGIKYSNRVDLTSEVRTKIALIANYGNNYGRITRLSARFNVSRTTVYAFRDQLRASMTATFSAKARVVESPDVLREATIRQILLLRLTGQSKLDAISTILAHNGHSRNSIGFISQILQAIGDKLPQVIDYPANDSLNSLNSLNWACDEIYYSGKVPILVTIEPISGAVLQIEIATKPLKEAWLDHWQNLKDKGIHPLCLISDEGWMLRAARLEQANWDFQPDTFHAVSHRLGIFAKRFEKSAYGAIEAEYEREALCLNTQKPNQLPLYKEQLAKRQQETLKALTLQSNFNFLYHCLLQQFNVFDIHGLPRKRAFAEAEVKCAIDLMRTLEIPSLNKELTFIEKLLPDLFNFLDKAADTYQKIIDSNICSICSAQLIPFWAIAWQYDKRSYKVKNNYAYQKKLREISKQFLIDLKQELDLNLDDFNILQATIFALFDAIIQSSAPVEMFNSILRPFLNQSRDQLSQQALNLIMDFYNHHTFKRGKRKGKSPLEILTGQKKDTPWLDKIIDLVRCNNI